MNGVKISDHQQSMSPRPLRVALIVDRTWRNRGIGTALVCAIEDWLQSQRALTMIVNSGQGRSVAHSFYQQLGFKITGVRFTKSLNDEI